MSTPNFTYQNILIAIEDPEEYDDFFYDDLISNIRHEIEHKLPKSYQEQDNWISDTGHEIASIPIYYQNGELYKSIDIILQSGYYSGASLYYIINEDNQERDPVNGKQSVVEDKTTKIIKQVEKILRQFGTELQVDGIFSNGEAVYSIKE